MFKTLLRKVGILSPLNDGGPPFPNKQFIILGICRLGEPIAFMSIFPYIYFMVEWFNITRDAGKIAVYAGLVTSSFAFAECLSGVIWGRLSDRIGRKPVLMIGLAGTGLSMITFGFATSLPVALISRALGGLLNGNIGVLQTTVGELIRVKKHQPRAYSIMPSVWCLGSMIGPALGGTLAHPCDSFPSFFARGSIFDRFPFLLPNLVCAFILCACVLVGILFLDETHPEKKNRRDVGREMGNWIIRRLTKGRESLPQYSALQPNAEEHLSVFEDEQPPGYRTTEGSPRISTTTPPVPPVLVAKSKPEIPPAKLGGVRQTCNRQIISIIAGYGILAFHSISFDQLMPVFLSAPTPTEPPTLPFKVTGGFGVSTRTIGVMLAVQGGYAMIAQWWLFPTVAGRLGALKTFRLAVMAWPLLNFVVPYSVLLPKKLQMPSMYACGIIKISLHVLAFPSNAILLRNSVPSLLVLGTINGMAASVASVSRGFGPAVTGLIHTVGLKIGSNGFGWWAISFMCFLGAIESMWIKESDVWLDQTVDNDEEVAPCLASPRIEATTIVDDTVILRSRDTFDNFKLSPAKS